MRNQIFASSSSSFADVSYGVECAFEETYGFGEGFDDEPGEGFLGLGVKGSHPGDFNFDGEEALVSPSRASGSGGW